ncbi:MAG: nucleotidyltransferase domain-containing protein [Myxococcota bacterium]|nr:nucleotidyltransferase domain-containing protein [Myxococcota bacterium]
MDDDRPLVAPQELDGPRREALADRVRAELAARPEVVAAYLHGSFARGEPFRDIDVAVLLAEPVSPEACRGVEAIAERAVAAYEVHVQVLNGAPPAFRHRVISEGRLIVDTRPTVRADFVEHALLEYLETWWMREEILRGAFDLDRGP